jgi:hypothetical protein
MPTTIASPTQSETTADKSKNRSKPGASVLDNYHTESKGRVGSTKDLKAKQLDALLGKVLPHLRYDEKYVWDANINGIVVRLVTNSRHQYEFWVENWYPAANDGTVQPHAFLYSVNGVPGEEPHAYYCKERNTSVFVNTEYYGQCKSWALGLAAVILEDNFNTHSIHGACAEVDGKGVVIVAPTGTGKTTQVNKIIQHPKGRLLGDDWIYIPHPTGSSASENPEFFVVQPERRIYVRTENAEEEDWLRPVFDRCKLENVLTDPSECHHEGDSKCQITELGEDHCYWGFGNSRAILPREWMLGEDKVLNRARMHLVVLLRRDDESPAVVELDEDEAIEVLTEGRTLIRPGAGPKEKWGTYGSEPWYNPYLLAPNHAKQERFFRDEIGATKCIIINTGKQSIQETYETILEYLENA